MAGRMRTSGTVVSSVPNPRSVSTPRLPGCPFLELSPDELGELMSPTLDLDELGPSIGTPGSDLSRLDYDSFLSVLGVGRTSGRAKAGSVGRNSLMVDRFDWS